MAKHCFKIGNIAIVAVATFFLIMIIALAPAVGAGFVRAEEGEAIMINTAEDFGLIRSNLGGKFQLGADIDFEGKAHEPIGDSRNPFRGELDGNRFTISNFKIETVKVTHTTVGSGNNARQVKEAVSGFFGHTNGIIKNLSFTGAEIILSEEADAGIVAGVNGGEISFVRASGEILINHNKASEEFTTVVGGIAGVNEAGAKILACFAELKSEVKADRGIYGGGIAGLNTGEINSCYALAEIRLFAENEPNVRADLFAGGIAGFNSASLESVRDIFGFWFTQVVGGGIIRDCYAKTTIELYGKHRGNPPSWSNIHAGGGIAGANLYRIINSVASCNLTAENSDAPEDALLVGGISDTVIRYTDVFYPADHQRINSGWLDYENSSFKTVFDGGSGNSATDNATPLTMSEIIEKAKDEWNSAYWNFSFLSPALLVFDGVEDGKIYAEAVKINFFYCDVVLHADGGTSATRLNAGAEIFMARKYRAEVFVAGELVFEVEFEIVPLIYKVNETKNGTEIIIEKIHPMAKIFLGGREITGSTILKTNGSSFLTYTLGGESKTLETVNFNNKNFTASYALLGAGLVLTLGAVGLIILRRKIK
ncbi:MAG: hypothetical protein FWD49_01155 [Firmicutes bacterium]|nr:hypothetical protein [Bacillota bacterium]